jgi:predicted HTH domain antitoxin
MAQYFGYVMETFTIRDLRERTGELVRGAESGELSVVTKHGQLVFLAVPMDEQLLRTGLALDLAIKLYRENVISLGKAARMAGLDTEAFMQSLGQLGIAVIDYDPAELNEELTALT